MIGMGSPALDAALDRYLTTPPEEPDSKLKCTECKVDIYPGEIVYRLDDEVYCRDCATEWLEKHSETVTDDMCYEE